MVDELETTDRWHSLLNTRYVCEFCLTRYFVLYSTCPACHQVGYIRPLVTALADVARSDDELRQKIAAGQTVQIIEDPGMPDEL